MLKVRTGYTSFTGEKLRSLRERMEELAQAFQIEEEPEGIQNLYTASQPRSSFNLTSSLLFLCPSLRR